MNTIKTISLQDIEKLKELHDKFFKNEFTFEDFCQPSISNFVVFDESDEIISAGAIRPIAEIVAITNYNKSARARRSALYQMLEISQFVLKATNFTHLHAFVQDEKWLNQLLSHGFKPCVGKPVFINVEK